MNKLEEIKKTLRDIQGELAQRYGVARLGIFGSVARGDFTDDSDVDILVEFSRPIGLEFVDLAEELERILNQRVDLVSRKAIKDRKWLYIERDVVYV